MRVILELDRPLRLCIILLAMARVYILYTMCFRAKLFTFKLFGEACSVSTGRSSTPCRETSSQEERIILWCYGKCRYKDQNIVFKEARSILISVRRSRERWTGCSKCCIRCHTVTSDLSYWFQCRVDHTRSRETTLGYSSISRNSGLSKSNSTLASPWLLWRLTVELNSTSLKLSSVLLLFARTLATTIFQWLASYYKDLQQLIYIITKDNRQFGAGYFPPNEPVGTRPVFTVTCQSSLPIQ